MNDKNNKDNKDKKNNPDNPFDFFKLSTDPAPDDGNYKRPRFPLWLILLGVFAVITAFNWFFMTKNDTAIDFSEFKKLISDGYIVRVELGDTYFIGYGADSATHNSAQRGTADGISPFLFSSASAQAKTYKTVGILTEDFLTLLDEKNVAYKAVKNQRSVLLQVLFNLVVPVGLLFLIYHFVFKRMGGLGGSIFSAGQSQPLKKERLPPVLPMLPALTKQKKNWLKWWTF